MMPTKKLDVVQPVFNIHHGYDMVRRNAAHIDSEKKLREALRRLARQGHPRTGFFASCEKAWPDSVGDWINPDWLRIEKEEQLHLVFCDGAGNSEFYSMKTGKMWDHDHEVGLDGGLREVSKTVGQFLSEMRTIGIDEPKAAPVPKRLTSKPSKWAEFLTAALGGAILGGSLGSLAGPVGIGLGAVAGAAGIGKIAAKDLYEQGLDIDLAIAVEAT